MVGFLRRCRKIKHTPIGGRVSVQLIAEKDFVAPVCEK